MKRRERARPGERRGGTRPGAAWERVHAKEGRRRSGRWKRMPLASLNEIPPQGRTPAPQPHRASPAGGPEGGRLQPRPCGRPGRPWSRRSEMDGEKRRMNSGKRRSFLFSSHFSPLSMPPTLHQLRVAEAELLSLPAGRVSEMEWRGDREDAKRDFACDRRRLGACAQFSPFPISVRPRDHRHGHRLRADQPGGGAEEGAR